MRSVLFGSVLAFAAACTDGGPCPTAGPCPDDGGSTDGSTGDGEDPGGAEGASIAVTATHTALGVTRSASGYVTVDFDREPRITGLDLEDPITVVVQQRHVSWATGYPVGTSILIRSLDLESPVPLVVGRTGTARVEAGVPLVVDVTITEPGGPTLSSTWRTELPWDLTVTASESDFAVAAWSDGFGGTFVVH